MKKTVCPCGAAYTEHSIEKIGGTVRWVCPKK